MRILLLGRNGQLGWELHRALSTLGDIHTLGYPEIDLVEPESLPARITRLNPDIIVNAAAYTAVDRAETDRERCMAINAHAPAVLAEVAKGLKAALIHYSTDYVFDGRTDRPNRETDPPNPLNWYGKSKLAGEKAIEQAGGAYLIFRTSWLYGLRRESFVTKTRRWARQNTTLRIVSDQIGNPTWARVLAEISAQIITLARGSGGRDSRSGPIGWLHEHRGLYHLAGDGCASRLAWAKKILELDPRPEELVFQALEPAKTSDFPSPAPRPLYSALDCSRFAETFGSPYGLRLPPWQDSLALALDQGS